MIVVNVFVNGITKMAIICRDIKLLFIMVPGTGCTAVGEILKRNFGGEYLPGKPILRDNRKLLGTKHNTVKQLVQFNLISQEELNSYLKLATVRNPFDRFATEYARLVGSWMESQMDVNNPNNWYSYTPEVERDKLRCRKLMEVKIAREDGFEKWLLKRIGHQKTYHRRVRIWLKSLVAKDRIHQQKIDMLYPMIKNVDYLLRYEKIEDDLNFVLKKIGISEQISVPQINNTPNKKKYQEYYTPKTRAIIESHFARELAMFEYRF